MHNDSMRHGLLMAWFKVDDGFYSSRKVLSIPRSRRFAALGLWTACGSWTMKELTDGYVPRYIVEEMGGTESEVNDLIAAKLWIEREDGYKFWDFTDWQRSAVQVKADRKTTSERRSAAGKKGAQTRWNSIAKSDSYRERAAMANSESADLPSITPFIESTPVTESIATWQSDGKDDGKTMGQSNPMQLNKENLAAAKPKVSNTRNSQIPKDWKPNANAYEFGIDNSVNVDHEAEQFRNHSAATGRTMKNWDAAFRVWLGNSVKWNKTAQTKAATDDWMNS
jgi:hypothetical protein